MLSQLILFFPLQEVFRQRSISLMNIDIENINKMCKPNQEHFKNNPSLTSEGV